MNEEMDEREVRYFGQEASIALQNRAFVAVVEEMQQDAMAALLDADPTKFDQVAILQLRVKSVTEVVERLEAMALRAASLEADTDSRTVNRDLN